MSVAGSYHLLTLGIQDYNTFDWEITDHNDKKQEMIDAFPVVFSDLLSRHDVVSAIVGSMMPTKMRQNTSEILSWLRSFGTKWWRDEFVANSICSGRT